MVVLLDPIDESCVLRGTSYNLHRNTRDYGELFVTEELILLFFQLSAIVIADIEEGSVTMHPNAKISRLPTYATDMYKFRYRSVFGSIQV